MQGLQQPLARSGKAHQTVQRSNDFLHSQQKHATDKVQKHQKPITSTKNSKEKVDQ